MTAGLNGCVIPDRWRLGSEDAIHRSEVEVIVQVKSVKLALAILRKLLIEIELAPKQSITSCLAWFNVTHILLLAHSLAPSNSISDFINLFL